MSGFWTPHLVSEHLVQAFRSFPDHAVFSTARTVTSFEHKTYGAHPSTADAFSWAPRFLGAYPKPRLHLFTWARCKAQKSSFRDMCREMDWPRQTVMVSRLLAASLIADGLNAEAMTRMPEPPVTGPALS